MQQIRFLINFNKELNKVAIIKAVRVVSGLGLKEAKDIVDKMSDNGEATVINVVGDNTIINNELRYLEKISTVFGFVSHKRTAEEPKIDPTVIDRKLHEALEAAVSFKDYRRARQILDLLS